MNTEQAADKLQESFDYMDSVFSAKRKPATVDLLEALKCGIVALREKPKRGEWEHITRYATKSKYKCPVCGRTIMAHTEHPEINFPFCHCGADMRGEPKDADADLAEHEPLRA